MKNTTKWIASIATAAAIFISANVNAQMTKTTTDDPWHLGIGVEGGAVTGAAQTVSNVELGGTVRLQYGPSGSIAYTLTSGYYSFLGKDIPGEGSTKYNSLGIVPVKVGVKLFFAPKVYFGAEAGAGFETNSYNYTKLILSPAVGYASKSWDVGVRYENFSGQSNNFGLVGLRVAYAFPL